MRIFLNFLAYRFSWLGGRLEGFFRLFPDIYCSIYWLFAGDGFVSGRSYFSCVHILSFIHSGHFYSAPSSPLPLRGAPDYSTDTVSEFHAEAHRQLQVKDLPKVPT